MRQRNGKRITVKEIMERAERRTKVDYSINAKPVFVYSKTVKLKSLKRNFVDKSEVTVVVNDQRSITRG